MNSNTFIRYFRHNFVIDCFLATLKRILRQQNFPIFCSKKSKLGLFPDNNTSNIFLNVEMFLITKI